MRGIVVDKDSTFVNTVELMMKDYYLDTENLSISNFCNANDFFEYYKFHDMADIIIIDVETVQGNDLDIATAIRQIDKNVFIIFVSNSTCHISTAGRVNASQYFIKPINKEAFYIELARIDSLIKSQLIVETNNKIQRIFLHGIYLIEMCQNKIFILLENEKIELKKRYSLKNLAKILQDKVFIRIHKSFIVNVESIKSYDTNCATLTNEVKCDIGRKYKNEFIERFNLFFSKLKRL